MYSNANSTDVSAIHNPWNKGRLIGPKPPLKLREIWAIRIRLQLTQRVRDLALFNLSIDSKLRGCICAHGSVRPKDRMRLKEVFYKQISLNSFTRTSSCPNQSAYPVLS